MENLQAFMNAVAGNPGSRFAKIEVLDNSKNENRCGVKVTLKPIQSSDAEELIGGASKGKVITWWTSPDEDKTAADKMVDHLSEVEEGRFTFVRELSATAPYEGATPAENGLYSQVRLVKYNGVRYKEIREANQKVIDSLKNKVATSTEEMEGQGNDLP